MGAFFVTLHIIVFKHTSSQFVGSSRLNGAGGAKGLHKREAKGKSKGGSKGDSEGQATSKDEGGPIRSLGPCSLSVCCVFMFC